MPQSILETTKHADGRYSVTFDDLSGVSFLTFNDLEDWSGTLVETQEDQQKRIVNNAVLAGDISSTKEIKPVKSASLTETILGFFGL